MNSSRRRFINRSGSCLLGASTLGSLAAVERGRADRNPRQDQEDPVLVTVYLRGGVDSLGVLVPYREKRYAEIRPTIAVPAPDAREGRVSLPLDGTFALNPNMPGLHALYEKGDCVPVVCVGSHHSTRSHFDAQDFMERGAPGLRHVKDGWLNRYLAETKSKRDVPLRALALQPRLPRSLRGSYPVLAVPEQGTTAQVMDEFSDLFGLPPAAEGSSRGEGERAMQRQIRQSGHDTIEQLRFLNDILAQSEGDGAPDYPDSPFARRMQKIAKVIKAKSGLEIAAVDYNGWDHHVDEGPVDGNMARHLASVSDGIEAFARDLGSRMSRVLVLVMSEFGRTVKENGNEGTDHGHGGLMLAVGGMLNGKQVCGRWTGLEAGKLYEERDLPVHTDFRVVLAETLHGLFGFDGIKAGLFPEYTPTSPPLEFMRPG